MMTPMCCDNCIFFHQAETHSGNEGVCRRYPPTVDPGGGSYMPQADKRLWCGEWQKAEKS